MLVFVRGLILYAIGAIMSLYLIDKLVEEDLEYRTSVIVGMSVFWILLIPLGVFISIVELIRQIIEERKRRKKYKEIEKYWNSLEFQRKIMDKKKDKEK